MCFLMADIIFIIIMFITRFMVKNHCWQYRGARLATTLTMHRLICKHGKMIFGLLEKSGWWQLKYLMMSTPKFGGRFLPILRVAWSFQKGGMAVQPPTRNLWCFWRLFAQVFFWLGNIVIVFCLMTFGSGILQLEN